MYDKYFQVLEQRRFGCIFNYIIPIFNWIWKTRTKTEPPVIALSLKSLSISWIRTFTTNIDSNCDNYWIVGLIWMAISWRILLINPVSGIHTLRHNIMNCVKKITCHDINHLLNAHKLVNELANWKAIRRERFVVSISSTMDVYLQFVQLTRYVPLTPVQSKSFAEVLALEITI